MERCTTCCVPRNFPGIEFDENGVCILCRDQTVTDFPYAGAKKLERDLTALLEVASIKRKYDCVVGFSGGRDSTYLPYYAKNILHLNVLAVSLTHKFIPQNTRDNIHTISSKLGVDVAFIENTYLDEYGTKSVQIWSKKPTPQMLLTFCTGCRYGIHYLISRYAADHEIPIVLMGDTPTEEFKLAQGGTLNFRREIFDIWPSHPSTVGKSIGYGLQIMKNPAYYLHLGTIFFQLKEYFAMSSFGQNVTVLKPFFNYVEWKKSDVDRILQKVGWSANRDFASEWRSDCYVNIIRQYYYRRFLGYNDSDYNYSHQVRKGLLPRDEALKKIEEETNYSPDFLARLMKHYYGLDFYEIEAKITKREKNTSQ